MRGFDRLIVEIDDFLCHVRNVSGEDEVHESDEGEEEDDDELEMNGNKAEKQGEFKMSN